MSVGLVGMKGPGGRWKYFGGGGILKSVCACVVKMRCFFVKSPQGVRGGVIGAADEGLRGLLGSEGEVGDE